MLWLINEAIKCIIGTPASFLIFGKIPSEVLLLQPELSVDHTAEIVSSRRAQK